MSIFTFDHRAVHETLKMDHFSVYCHRKTSFWRCFLNLCGICTETIIHHGVSESGRYLPRCFAVQ